MSHLVDDQDEEGKQREDLRRRPFVEQKEARNSPLKEVVQSCEQLWHENACQMIAALLFIKCICSNWYIWRLYTVNIGSIYCIYFVYTQYCKLQVYIEHIPY